MGRRRKRVRVRKSSGRLENFNRDKLRSSLLRAGADGPTADGIIEEVLDRVEPETSSGEIYRLAHRRLGRRSTACGMRYTLKRALFRLGPTGYPFEHFVGLLFRHHGWKTETGVTVRGRCASHEIDVLASRDSEVAVMECKYHNSKGTTTDVKTALYVNSRVRDLRPSFTGGRPGIRYSGWLVTNTRCTSDALEYARCAGIKVLSWKYPEGRGLEEMIEGRRLYPVTVLYGMEGGLVEKLVGERILLLKDLTAIGAGVLSRRLGISVSTAEELKRRAEALCT